MLKLTVVFCAVLAVGSAWQALMDLQPIPDKYKGQTGCYIEDLDAVIPFRQKSPSKKGCQEYQCGGDIVTIVGCGAAYAEPPCTMVEDKSKPFPECCPKIKCSKMQAHNLRARSLQNYQEH